MAGVLWERSKGISHVRYDYDISSCYLYNIIKK
jgi:hypothetical protein